MRCQSTSSHGARCFLLSALQCRRYLNATWPQELECNQVKKHACLRAPESQRSTESPPLAGLCAQTNEHLRTLEDTHAALQQTDLLAGVINEQDCRDIRTACDCTRRLRIRVEARANVTEREVISRQLQLMHACVQHYPTEDLNIADTSCLSRTSFEHFEDRPSPRTEKHARIPTPR